MSGKDIFFNINNQQYAAKTWGKPDNPPILALHGWLDNAASFDNLAPYLQDFYLVSLDLPGHGLAFHRPENIPIHMVDFVLDAYLVIEHFGWQQCILLGHSLGAIICSILAGTIPEKFKAVALIDALGPLTTAAENTPLQLRKFISSHAKSPSTPPKYQTKEEAIKARLNVTPMQYSSAEILVNRGIIALEGKYWSWRTDPRLLKPSANYLTEEQGLAILSNIEAPTMVIRPQPGYPFPEEIIQRRMSVVKHIWVHKIPGLHHVHLDAPQSVADKILPFLQEWK